LNLRFATAIAIAVLVTSAAVGVLMGIEALGFIGGALIGLLGGGIGGATFRLMSPRDRGSGCFPSLLGGLLSGLAAFGLVALICVGDTSDARPMILAAGAFIVAPITTLVGMVFGAGVGQTN
jgi:hypothetical protein